LRKVHWTPSFLILLTLLSGCLLTPLPRNPILQGRVFIEELEKNGIQGHPVPNATLQVLDIESGKVLAESKSNQEGHYSLSVPPGGPYLVQATQDNLKLLDFSPVTEENNIYNLGLTGIISTATTLTLLEIAKEDHNPQSVDIDFIKNAPKFGDLLETIQRIVINGGNPVDDEDSLRLARELARALFSNSQNATEIPVSLPPHL